MFKVLEINKNYSINENGVVINNKRNKEIKPFIAKNGKGYLSVSLYNKNIKQGNFYVHRLLAQAFIPNPLGKKEVNHINGNTLDNSLDNLEWVTHKENIEHAVKVTKVFDAYRIHTNGKKKKVKQIDKTNNKTIAIFDSIREAEKKTKVNGSYISKCINGKQKYAKGYYWVEVLNE